MFSKTEPDSGARLWNPSGKLFSARKYSKISCVCEIEFEGCSEFEALDKIYKMFEKEFSIAEKTTLKLTEIITTSADGCSISYKEKQNGNV
jgi:hypothetical protein